jgi:hypothetical protein
MTVARSLCLAFALCLSGALVYADGFASSPNFVVLAAEQQTADTVLARAESLRKKMALKWLGSELPAGEAQTIIIVQISRDGNRSEFLAGPNSRTSVHALRLIGPEDEIFGTTIAHEIVHLVMQVAHEGKLPRWANEGVAMFEDEDRHGSATRAIVEQYSTASSVADLEQVLAEKGFDGNLMAYALSHYFTAFLLRDNDTRAFFGFAKASGENGWESAARQYYRMSSRQLQAAWLTWLIQTLHRDRLASRDRAPSVSATMYTRVQPLFHAQARSVPQ